MANVETLIVGGGISGICIAIQLLKAGKGSFLVVEKSGDVGGTWRVNQYPGCACDVPSHLYSFSFDQNPSWSKMYAERQEIHEYLKRCAHSHGILPHFRFHTLAHAAAWDESAALWRVHLQDALTSEASTISAKFLVHAIGSLHVPKLPPIKGMERFAGPSFHSSSWDSSVNLRGKKVAIIGTGASAIQIVPMIASSVEKLYVCQRTPAWIFPKPNFAIANLWKILFRKVPLLMWLFSCCLYLLHEVLVCFFVKKLRMGRFGEWVAVQHMKWYIKDVEMRDLLVPKYELGCKRTLISNTFYPALSRLNVELLADPILEINEHNMLLSVGSEKLIISKKVDVIIYATGFDPFSPSFQVTGCLGQSLTHVGSSSMLGITKHGFPNFFMLLGPNTTLGHTSLILMVEAQANYIINCMKLVPPFARLMELCHSSELRYQEFLAHRLANSIWHSGGCNSWYFDPKTNQNDIIWPASALEYKYRSWYVNPLDYNFQ